MIFKKDYGELVNQSLTRLLSRTDITNTTIGGITRSIIEVINLNIAEYYSILDINTTMGFISTAEGYFLDLIGQLFAMSRITPTTAVNTTGTLAQKIYVTVGTLTSRIPGNVIPQGTIISTPDGSIRFTVTSATTFAAGATEVFVPIMASGTGSQYNVGVNGLTRHNLGPADVYTTNTSVVVGGAGLESDDNFRYRIINASLSAERANETAIRLAALSTPGVADIIIRPYSRGIGTFTIIVIPVEGIANDNLIAAVQTNINTVTAYGLSGVAIKPDVIPVDIEVRLVFVNGVTENTKTNLRSQVRTAISRYIVNIPIGNSFIMNELRQRIMDVSDSIKDHIITCYNFREQPVFMGNVDAYWDEIFYPNPNSSEAIRVL